jgi:hypothetical protein
MERMIYVLQFKGQAGPVEGASGVLKATTSAPSCRVSTEIGAGGVRGDLQELGGGTARFESEVTMAGDNAFKESGTITFGEGGNRLRFSTVGQGYLGPSADPKTSTGAVTWQIDAGEGQFEGATGLITSNFMVGESGEVIDNHFGVIFLR